MIWLAASLGDKPAPTNLEIPPHAYLSDTRLVIGESKGALTMANNKHYDKYKSNGSVGGNVLEVD